jgi:hypothetical protein
VVNAKFTSAFKDRVNVKLQATATLIIRKECTFMMYLRGFLDVVVVVKRKIQTLRLQ